MAGGCFWCTEAIFQRLKGVEEVLPGYIDGKVKNPSYREVCSGRTGHTEAISITYNPKVIYLTDLLLIFFNTHDPTTLNRQGPNVGYQYRSEIFYNTEEEKMSAQNILDEVNKKLNGKIQTNISKFNNYCKAEEYHQKYIEKNT